MPCEKYRDAWKRVGGCINHAGDVAKAGAVVLQNEMLSKELSMFRLRIEIIEVDKQKWGEADWNFLLEDEKQSARVTSFSK